MREKKVVSFTTACCLILTTLPSQNASLHNSYMVHPKRPSQSVIKMPPPLKPQNKKRNENVDRSYDDSYEKEVLYRLSLQRRKEHMLAVKAAQAQTAKSRLTQRTTQISLSSRGSTGLLDFDPPTGESDTKIAASTALRFLGSPYKWSGNTPDGFDCSGFVQYIFGLIGIQLPRTSFDQFRAGIDISSSELQPGDLVFFSTYARGASHVGIYIGKGSFIQCLNSSTGVVLSRVDDPYYKERFVGAKRIPSSE